MDGVWAWEELIESCEMAVYNGVNAGGGGLGGAGDVDEAMGWGGFSTQDGERVGEYFAVEEVGEGDARCHSYSGM